MSDNDKVQIGLTSSGQQHLDVLMEKQYFEDRQDAYRVAVAVAMARGLTVSDEDVRGAITRYNFAGGIDRDGKLRTLIGAFAPDYAATPAIYSERAAHAGLAWLAERLGDDTATFSEVLVPVSVEHADVEMGEEADGHGGPT